MVGAKATQAVASILHWRWLSTFPLYTGAVNFPLRLHVWAICTGYHQALKAVGFFFCEICVLVAKVQIVKIFIQNLHIFTILLPNMHHVPFLRYTYASVAFLHHVRLLHWYYFMRTCFSYMLQYRWRIRGHFVRIPSVYRWYFYRLSLVRKWYYIVVSHIVLIIYHQRKGLFKQITAL